MRSVRLDLHLDSGTLSSGGRNRFRPGELVSGWLDVECLEPTSCRSISVGAQPHVVGPHSNDGYSPLPRRLLFQGELPVGKQRFPFSMPLPAGPISHEGEFASLSWRLHAALDRLAAPRLITPKRLTLGDTFEVFCLWPRGWAHPGRVDVEVAAVESRVTQPRTSYLPPLIEHAYPFGVAADLESVPLAEVPAPDNAARKQYGGAFRARLHLPADAVPTHPLIFWTVRVRARGDKRRRNVRGKELVWERERVVEVLPWWGDRLSATLSAGTQSTRVVDESVKVSEAPGASPRGNAEAGLERSQIETFQI